MARAERGSRLSAHLWRRRESFLGALWLSPLIPLAWLYALGARLHRMAYRVGLLRAVHLPVRVVSVGNLSVGGSGKTPLAAWLARELHARGVKVALLSRGVGGRRSDQVNVVSDGSRIWLGPSDVGDEPVLLAQEVPGVPVLAGRNRAALALRASSTLGVELVLLDDGFQHHRVARDLDLVCIEAGLGLGNGWTLPRGPLREPTRVLFGADAWIVTRVATRAQLRAGEHAGQWDRARAPSEPPRTPADEDLDREQAGSPSGVGAPRRFHFSSSPLRLRPLQGGASSDLGLLRDAEVGVLTAIARPDRFCRDLEAWGARIVEVCAFPDHHLYRRSDLEGLDRSRRWITTAKDAVKIPPEWTRGCSIHVLEEGLQELGSGRLADWVLEQLGLEGRGCEADASALSANCIDSEAP